MTVALVKYEAARQALAEAHRVDEVKDLRDKALALTAYAQQAKDGEMVKWATEIQVRAERRAGDLLQETAAAGQRQTRGDRKAMSSRNDIAPVPTLADLGITRDQSSDWQKLAAIPEKEFESRLEVAQAESPRITITAPMEE